MANNVTPLSNAEKIELMQLAARLTTVDNKGYSMYYDGARYNNAETTIENYQSLLTIIMQEPSVASHENGSMQC